MSLHLHRSERADDLVAGLAAELATPLADAFAIELVAVPTPGIERWLSQRLAGRLGATPGRGDGVCAGVDFPSPGRLVATATADFGPSGADDPWRPAHAVWPLLTVIDTARGADWAHPLWSYLGQRGGSAVPVAAGARRWATARRLAGLFADYAAYRPAMLARWLAGHDEDPSGVPLAADRAWQAELWRRLRGEIGIPSPAERLDELVAALIADPGRVRAPERLSVFGLTRLDPTHGRVLAALARHREVHLWLSHPSPALWAAVADEGGAASRGPRVDDRTVGCARHRLLGYLGRDARELQICLDELGPATDHPVPAPVDRARVDSLLTRLQADIVANRMPDTPVRLDPDDHSVTVHATHGPDRQVEVLREVLVGLLADDPTLEPRDIVVMCPDIESYAPLIAATFGLDEVGPGGPGGPGAAPATHPGHRLRVRLADRSLRELNPLLATITRLLALADARVTGSELIDLAAAEPVARRFRFSADDLTRVQELVDGAGVRWGLDAAHREAFAMSGFAQNTWAAGLDRLLLGVTMDETGQHYLGTALPMDAIDSGDVDLVGRLAEFVDRVSSALDDVQSPRPLAGWVTTFRAQLGGLTSVAPADGWQLTHAHAQLTQLAETARDDVDLSRAEVSALLADAFRGRPTRANFRTGTLTMCTLQPMRSIPHRVVCLLGLDDATFPRRSRVDGDDLLTVPEWVGDPDVRSEDRQLLLDALLAAQERLVVLYTGRDARTGEELPPAVPLGEILDALDATARTPDRRTARQALVRQHPLQPFDPANFLPAFSFDKAAHRGAQALAGPRAPRHPTYERSPLPPAAGARVVELADLHRFLAHPVKALLRDRAALFVGGEEEESPSELPIDLNGLQRWQIGNRLLTARLAGADLPRLVDAEWRRGTLPPRRLGGAVIEGVAHLVGELAEQVEPLRTGPAERHEISVGLETVRDGPVALVGTVAGVFGTTLVRCEFGGLSPKHRLDAWIDLLAIQAERPDVEWNAVVVADGGRCDLGPVPAGAARAVLADLLDLRHEGLCEPLPFAVRTSARYARLADDGRGLDPAARRQLQQEWAFERDAALGAFFGPSLDDLLAEPARPGDDRGGLRERNRFGALARRVFRPLGRAET